MGNDLVCQ